MGEIPPMLIEFLLKCYKLTVTFYKESASRDHRSRRRCLAKLFKRCYWLGAFCVQTFLPLLFFADFQHIFFVTTHVLATIKHDPMPS